VAFWTVRVSVRDEALPLMNSRNVLPSLVNLSAVEAEAIVEVRRPAIERV
jgi:hypothetical protein